ncbi:N-acyl homoserine lactonase family protein [Mesobacterium pallidum]|uniref:N-acyl homoserine lactonase family protein n=1 Tax=Mesobacterium pallidum TaxID=2872037 RepID=UPI001EE199D7|nr:N-acyl homoserine lactonase family protein [Mesobacterium pallidum]
MTDIRRLYVLLCGYEIIPKTVSTRDLGARFVLSVPITAYLLDTASGWVLFDTALDESHLNDPEAKRRMFTDAGWDPAPVVRPHHELGRQLAEIGIGFEDIGTVILSHLHADHTGHLKHMPQAQVIVQRAELEAGQTDPLSFACFGSDFRLPGIMWQPIDGDAEILPGLTALSTPGHTIGHMSLRVDLPGTGPVILTADVGDLRENFEHEILPGASVDDTAALASIRRINALVAETGALMLMTHDPDQIQQIRLAPDFYD